jgi:hypothetical protein
MSVDINPSTLLTAHQTAKNLPANKGSCHASFSRQTFSFSSLLRLPSLGLTIPFRLSHLLVIEAASHVRGGISLAASHEIHNMGEAPAEDRERRGKWLSSSEVTIPLGAAMTTIAFTLVGGPNTEHDNQGVWSVSGHVRRAACSQVSMG